MNSGQLRGKRFVFRKHLESVYLTNWIMNQQTSPRIHSTYCPLGQKLIKLLDPMMEFSVSSLDEVTAKNGQLAFWIPEHYKEKWARGSSNVFTCQIITSSKIQYFLSFWRLFESFEGNDIIIHSEHIPSLEVILRFEILFKNKPIFNWEQTISKYYHCVSEHDNWCSGNDSFRKIQI